MSQTQPPVDPSLNSLLATLSPLNLLRSLSHELRAPLAAILGWTEWLLEGTTEAHQPAEGIRHIRSAAEKMLQLLDDYYDLARFGDEEATATAATDLLVTLRRICHGLDLVAQQRRQTLRIEAEDRIPSLAVSPTLRQALWLVVRYLLRAAPEGATVTLSPDLAASPLRLLVSSDQGLSETADPGGLNLARLFITREGGTLAVERLQDTWRLIIQLPTVHPTSATDLPSFTESPQLLNPIPSTISDTKKVLVIDDDENLLKLLGAVVSAAGYRPYLAASGVRGVEAARATAPDVVLLDIGMPGMDGFATFNALRTEPCLAKSKIVALTAYTSVSERERIARHGFDGFIPKPFRREQLIQVLSELSV
ncbi:MAG: hybrid sensor histidine kinase/response regulator [Chloracidobacterium sp.]